MIVAEHLSKLYGARWALTDVSFSIAEREVVGFLGLNGAGKTTVLKILCGVLWPSAGRVRVAGFDSQQRPEDVRRCSGFLPDQPPLYGEMSVRAMLRYTGLLNGVAGARIDRRVGEVLEICHLNEVASDLIAWLSHGYRKRVGIAQAIVHEPALVVLDEPTSGLDPEQIIGMRGLVRRLAERHTVLISSHNLFEIERSCDRILVLHRGRIVALGAEDSLRREVLRGRVELTLRGGAERIAGVSGQVRGVSDVSIENGDGVVVLKARTADDLAQEALVQALVEHGIGVRRVGAAQGAGLEDVFLQLTRGALPERAA